MSLDTALVTRLGHDFRVAPPGPLAGVEHVPTGLVLRLIPGGTFTMGVSGEEIDDLASLFDGRLEDLYALMSRSTPAHVVQVAPFLCAEEHVPLAVAAKFVAAQQIDSHRALVRPKSPSGLVQGGRQRSLVCP